MEVPNVFKDLDDENKKKLRLSSKGIKLALEREFTELILWQSNDENLVKFKEYLNLHDLNLLKVVDFIIYQIILIKELQCTGLSMNIKILP